MKSFPVSDALSITQSISLKVYRFSLLLLHLCDSNHFECKCKCVHSVQCDNINCDVFQLFDIRCQLCMYLHILSVWVFVCFRKVYAERQFSKHQQIWINVDVNNSKKPSEMIESKRKTIQLFSSSKLFKIQQRFKINCVKSLHSSKLL